MYLSIKRAQHTLCGIRKVVFAFLELRMEWERGWGNDAEK